MESNSPKRSNIGQKAMTPTDRIKANATTHKPGTDQKEPHRDLTKSRDLNKGLLSKTTKFYPNHKNVGQTQLASPNAKTSTAPQSPAKLGYNRSACDISSSKRPELTLPPMPPGFNESVVSTPRRTGQIASSHHVNSPVTSKTFYLGSRIAPVATMSNAPKTNPGLVSRAAKTSTTPQSPAKLGYNRSACDISSSKRPELTLPPMPPGFIESGVSTARRTGQIASSHVVNSPVTCKTYLRARTAAVATMRSAPKINPGLVSRAAKPTAVKKTATNAAESTTTEASKPINKRIPSYDFKARYHVLLEKFQSLEEKFGKTNDERNHFENLSAQFKECQTELEAAKEEFKNTKTEKETFRNQAEVFENKMNALSMDVEAAKKKLETVEEKHKIMSAENSALREKNATLEEINRKRVKENKELHEKLRLYSERLFQFNMERKQLYNALMDLRGKICVFCHIRQPLPCETDKPVCGWKYIDEVTVKTPNHELLNKNKPGGHTFNFDYVIHPGCRQEDIFELVSPLIQSAMGGYNVCIFAYGQTVSGKTYTMDGIASGTVDLIFQSIENYKCVGWSYIISATFLEIYNEVLFDLLSNEQEDIGKEVRITEETVLTAEHLRDLMRIAKMNRATSATVENERSSPSHAVTRIQLIGYHENKNESSIGTVNLVDLAGSESPETSLPMDETKNANRSLSELTNVILGLLQKQDHIPYRNSKLTHLLMPTLGGNSKTLMFINVAPFVDCYAESVNSLRFAASVNSCKVDKAKRHRFLNATI